MGRFVYTGHSTEELAPYHKMYAKVVQVFGKWYTLGGLWARIGL